MIRDRQPTVSEIIAELDKPTDAISFCRNVGGGVFHSWVDPAEIYIEAIGTWLRCDGSHAGFALNGMREYGQPSRRQLRAAVDRWINRRARHADYFDSLLTWARDEQAFPTGNPGGQRGHIDENHRFKLRDMIAVIDRVIERTK